MELGRYIQVKPIHITHKYVQTTTTLTPSAQTEMTSLGFEYLGEKNVGAIDLMAKSLI